MSLRYQKTTTTSTTTLTTPRRPPSPLVPSPLTDENHTISIDSSSPAPTPSTSSFLLPATRPQTTLHFENGPVSSSSSLLSLLRLLTLFRIHPQVRCLIVDDDALTRKLMSRMGRSFSLLMRKKGKLTCRALLQSRALGAKLPRPRTAPLRWSLSSRTRTRRRTMGLLRE